MSTEWRRKTIAGVVIFVLLWPAVHIGLVAHFRIDPWELFGWSMYALPAGRVQVRVELLLHGHEILVDAVGGGPSFVYAGDSCVRLRRLRARGRV